MEQEEIMKQEGKEKNEEPLCQKLNAMNDIANTFFYGISMIGLTVMMAGVLSVMAYSVGMTRREKVRALAEVEKARIEAGLELKIGDYNGNQVLDKFYEIDGQKVPLEVDGKSIDDYFRQ